MAVSSRLAGDLSARHAHLQAARRPLSFVHDAAAQGLCARLQSQTLAPQRLLEVRLGKPGVNPQLLARYPTAQALGLGGAGGNGSGRHKQNQSLTRIAATPAFATASRSGKHRWYHRLQAYFFKASPVDQVIADLCRLPFAAQSFDLICSPLALQSLADPATALAEMGRCLRTNGVLMACVLGATTARELRAAARQANWGEKVPEFADLHDWGDALVALGFAEPVIEQETLSLQYSSPARLLADARSVLGNPVQSRFAGLRSRAAHARLCAALMHTAAVPAAAHATQNAISLQLTVELVFLRAWRRAPSNSDADADADDADYQRIDVSALRRTRIEPLGDSPITL